MINGDARSGCEGLLAYGPLSLAGSYEVELRSRVCMRRIIPTFIQLQYPHDHILLRDAADPFCPVSNQRLPPTCASQVVGVVRRDLPLCLIRRRVNRRPWLCIHRYCPPCCTDGRTIRNPVERRDVHLEPIAVVAIAIMTSGMAVAADAIEVKKVADPVRHPYQQTASFDCGTSPNGYLVVFPAITTARTVVLHASCAMSLSDSNIIAYVSLSDSTLQIPSYLPVTRYSTTP